MFPQMCIVSDWLYDGMLNQVKPHIYVCTDRSFHFLLQAELKVAEYNKLGRKLKLIPQSAENACGHDFEIRTDYSATTITQYKTQIQVQSLLPSSEASFFLFFVYLKIFLTLFFFFVYFLNSGRILWRIWWLTWRMNAAGLLMWSWVWKRLLNRYEAFILPFFSCDCNYLTKSDKKCPIYVSLPNQQIKVMKKKLYLA